MAITPMENKDIFAGFAISRSVGRTDQSKLIMNSSGLKSG